MMSTAELIEELQIVAELGDAADVKALAGRLVSIDQRVAIDLRRAVKGQDVDREAIAALAVRVGRDSQAARAEYHRIVAAWGQGLDA